MHKISVLINNKASKTWYFGRLYWIIISVMVRLTMAHPKPEVLAEIKLEITVVHKCI